MVEKEMTRRRFLVMASGTVAAAVLAGCVRKEEIDTILSCGAGGRTNCGGNECPCSDSGIQSHGGASQPNGDCCPTAQKNVRSACPRGLVNDPYPGKCKRYVDKNGNGICDLSEV